MDLAQRFRINKPSIVNELIDGEAVMINLDTGSYYSADKIGAVIWALLAAGASGAEIIADIGCRFEGGPAEIQQGVESFLDHLLKEKLVVPDAAVQPSSVVDNAPPPVRVPFQNPKLDRYDDMQDLLLADPIHDVPETGWPNQSQA